MFGFHPVSSAPVSALTTRPLAVSTDNPVYAQATQQLGGRNRNLVSRLGNSWVDLGGVVVSADLPVYAQSSPKPSRLKPLANVWNDRDFASDIPSTVAQAQIKRVASKNGGAAWVDLSDSVVVSDSPIYGQSSVRSARSKPLSGAWNDLDFASDGLPIIAQSQVKRVANKNSGAAWFDISGAVVSSDVSVYAQSLAKRIVRATTGGAAWTDLSTVVSADDLAVYGQSNQQFSKQRIKSSAWVDFDASIAASSDLSPYAQSILRRKQISAASYAWGDLDTSIVASSDLSPYAQSISRQKQALAKSTSWVNPDRDDAPIYAQNNAKQRAAAAYSSYWVNLEPTVSSDLSPYAQTDVSRETLRVTRRNTGTVWNSGDDFFPPQDDLSAYGQSRYSQAKLAYRPRSQGNAWVDLIDAIGPPIVPPASGGGVPSSGRVRRDFGKYPQTKAETHQERVALGIIREVAKRIEVRALESESEQLAALEAEFALLNLQFQTTYWLLLQREIVSQQQLEDELQQVFMLTVLTI